MVLIESGTAAGLDVCAGAFEEEIETWGGGGGEEDSYLPVGSSYPFSQSKMCVSICGTFCMCYNVILLVACKL